MTIFTATATFLPLIVLATMGGTVNSYYHGHPPRPLPSPPPDHDVIIIGGSIVGLATAVALSSSSSSSPPRIAVYERAKEAKPVGALLSLFPNGLTALRSIDSAVADEVERVSIPLRASEIKDGADGNVLGRRESNDAGDGSGGTFLCWYQLQRILSSALEGSFGDVVKSGMEFVSYDVDDATGLVTVTCRDRNNDDAELHSTCRVLIGADGIQSSVRRQLARGQGTTKLNSYNRTIFRALVDIETLRDDSIVPPTGIAVIYKSDVVGQIFKVWTASDNTLAITTTVNSDEDDAAVRLWSEEVVKEKMAEAYAQFAPEVRDLISQIPASSIYANAVCDMECPDIWSDGPVVVIGDAAHSMTPSLGQGANVGLEDAAEIGYLLRQSPASGGDENYDDLINNFCITRQRRVKEIHAASRRQALNKNQKATTLASFMTSDPAFFERLYGWTPMGSSFLTQQ